jgi:TPR repeat protein
MSDMRANVPKTSENIIRAAESGNLDAQCELGMMFEHGLGMPKDPQAALLWYRTAADRGSGYAAYKLALMFENGNGVQQDMVQTANWLKRASECGLPEAQYKLGLMLESGRGINQRWPEAAAWYLQAANQGVVEAQFRLGFMYENGMGVQKDMQAAARYYKLAADRGNAGAQYNLAVMYVTGEGVEKKDTVEAARLFELAATNGHARAKQKFSEQMSKQTRPIEREAQPEAQDDGTPKWFRKPTDEHYDESLGEFMMSSCKSASILSVFLGVYCLTPLGDIVQHAIRSSSWFIFFFGLGLMVISGFGAWTLFKRKMSMPWFQVAGFGIIGLFGMIIVGVTCFGGYELQPLIQSAMGVGGKNARLKRLASDASSSSGHRLTAQEQMEKIRKIQKDQLVSIAKARAAEEEAKQQGDKSNAQLMKGAQNGDPKSQFQLASRYESGEKGIPQDESSAISYYQQAASNNNKPAQTRLGIINKRPGADGQAHYDESVKWLTKAANQKYPAAQYQLALMYEFGEGVPKNYKAAADWYGKAAADEDRWAQFRLGTFHLEGTGVEQSYDKAVKLFTASAGHHYWKAEDKLSELYTSGLGVTKSPEMAKKWASAAEKDKKRKVKPGTEEWLHETVEDNEGVGAELGQTQGSTGPSGGQR